MSEYQRYEFMTIDRPLTRAQLDEVNDLSSHIEASSTHAVIEYHWGDFKHNPIKVLRKYFDGFLYWANWGTPQLALRFPHAVLPADLLESYNFDNFVTFTQHPDYDILHIQAGEMESPDEMADYELGSLIALRDELMEGDLRSLYVLWLANQPMSKSYGTYDEDEDNEEEEDEDEYEDYEEEEDEEDEEESRLPRSKSNHNEDAESNPPPVPSAFGALTVAQQELAELFQVPNELVVAAAEHSTAAEPKTGDNFPAWIRLLSADRRTDFLLRLAQNEPGLSRLFVRELRELGLGKTLAPLPSGERVPYATLLAESKVAKAEIERERRRQEQLAHQRHLQDLYEYRDTYWRQVEREAQRGNSSGYDAATRLLIDLRESAEHFQASQEFQERFSTWIQSHLRRPALLKRLQGYKFTLPDMQR